MKVEAPTEEIYKMNKHSAEFREKKNSDRSAHHVRIYREALSQHNVPVLSVVLESWSLSLGNGIVVTLFPFVRGNFNQVWR